MPDRAVPPFDAVSVTLLPALLVAGVLLVAADWALFVEGGDEVLPLGVELELDMHEDGSGEARGDAWMRGAKVVRVEKREKRRRAGGCILADL